MDPIVVSVIGAAAERRRELCREVEAARWSAPARPAARSDVAQWLPRRALGWLAAVALRWAGKETPACFPWSDGARMVDGGVGRRW